MKTLNNLKIAIGSIARDIENNFNNYAGFLYNLEKYFDFDLFIYENNSFDNTKSLISKITNFYQLENLNIPKFGNVATEARSNFLAICRNKLKDLIFNKKDYDVIIFCDCDITTWPKPKIIINNIIKILEDSNLGAITSNGISIIKDINNSVYRLIYYDIWSLVINNMIFNHQIVYANDILENIYVDSAFGGLTIYNGKYIKNLKYKCLYLDGYEGKPLNRPCSEHVGLNLELRIQNYQILIDKEQILYI